MYKTKELKDAVALIWNSHVPEADDLLKPNNEQPDPRYALHYAENAWLWGFLTDDTKLLAKAKLRLRVAKKTAAEWAKKSKPKNKEGLNQQIDSLIIHGEALLFHAFHQMAANNYAKGCLELSSAWNLIQDAEKLSASPDTDPELLLLVRFDMGMFLYFLSFLPEVIGSASKLLSILGFKGDRERGAAYLWEVARSESLRSGFAYSVLLSTLIFMPENHFPISQEKSDLAVAAETLEEALQRYPDGLTFLSLKGLICRRSGQTSAAIGIFQNLCQRFTELGGDDSLPRLNIGNTYFNLLRWNEAAEQFAMVEARRETYVRYYQAVYFRGVCVLMNGNVDEAHELMNQACRAAKANSDDEFFKLTDRCTNNGYAALFETLIDRDEFAFESQEHLEGIQQKLTEFSEVLGINPQDRGESPHTKKFKHSAKQKSSNALLLFALQARVQQKLGNKPEALNLYNKAAGVKPAGEFEKSFYWQTLFEQADLAYSLGNKEEAITILKKISKDGNSTRIKHAARKALQKIESGQI